MAFSRRIVLHFPRRLVERPIVYRLVKDFDLEFNILKASITPEEEGVLVMELKGEKEEYDKGIQFLSETGVRIQPLSQDVARNEARCTDCGVCLNVCPAGAFELEPGTRKVAFHEDKCIGCSLCIKACPPRAMQVQF